MSLGSRIDGGEVRGARELRTANVFWVRLHRHVSCVNDFPAVGPYYEPTSFCKTMTKAVYFFDPGSCFSVVVGIFTVNPSITSFILALTLANFFSGVLAEKVGYTHCFCQP